MYSFDGRVRYSEVDEDGYLRLVSLINYLQDCSTFQSEDLDIGVKHLKHNQIAWVLMGSHIEIDYLPRYCDHITISTWCSEIKRLIAKRNFTITTDAGYCAVKADSTWSMFSLAEGKAQSIPESEYVYLTNDKALDIGPVVRKLPLDGKLKRCSSIVVADHHLDTNRHVNNAQYVQIALDALNSASLYIPQQSVSQIDALYKRQAHLGDVVIPTVCQTEGSYTVSLDTAEGEPYAIIRFTIRL